MKCNARTKVVRKEAVQEAVHYMLLSFVSILGDKYNFPNYRIVEAIKHILALSESFDKDYTTLRETEAAIYADYGIKFEDDGRVWAVDERDNLFAPGEWRELKRYQPNKEGSYLITTDKGAVCQAYWHGTKFSGAAGNHAVAWREKPEPWEFWKE